MLSRFRIGPKLYAGFGAVAFLALLVGAIGLRSLGGLEHAGTRLYTDVTQPIASMVELSTDYHQVQAALLAAVLESEPAKIREQFDTISSLRQEMKEDIERLSLHVTDPGIKATLNEYRNAEHEYYDTAVPSVADLAHENVDQAAYQVIQSSLVSGPSENLERIIVKLVSLQVQQGEQTNAMNIAAARSARFQMGTVMALVLAAALVLGVLLTRSITHPLNKMAQAAAQIARGNIAQQIDHRSGDETGMLADSFRETISYVQQVAQAADALARGDLTTGLTPRSAEDVLTQSFIKVSDSLRQMAVQTRALSEATVNGKLSTRAETAAFSGVYAEIAESVNRVLDSVIVPLKVAADYVDRIARGQLPPKISETYRGEFNEVKNNLNTCIDAIQALVADAAALAEAAQQGRLSTRVDAARHQGDYGRIIDGVNRTLDAVIGPLNLAAEYIDRISKGNVPPPISEPYPGDFNELRNNLNTCIQAINALVTDANALAEAAIQGKLATRVDHSRHGGDFGRIIDGVNRTLDAVIGPLNVAAEYVDRIAKGQIPPRISDVFPGDFNGLRDNLNTCIDAINALVKDADMLATAALRGELFARANTSLHGGDFARVIDGVNRTLDNVAAPLGDIGRVLDMLASRDFTARISARYEGDYDIFKVAVNTACGQMQDALKEVTSSAADLTDWSVEMSRTSQQMAESAGSTSNQADRVSTASQQVTRNVQTVALSAEQLGASVKEIARNAAEATQVARSAVGLAQSTNETVNQLGRSSAEIGEVVKVITNIAQQTNLLALNATIEAARAGDAGKGFAVVANEVKELAKETARATENITRRIDAIQGDTSRAVAAIAQITQVIGQINDIQGTIASMVEEQSATTASIERNVTEAAKATAEISDNIVGVAKAASVTSLGASNTLTSAQGLTKMATDLNQLVGRFKI